MLLSVYVRRRNQGTETKAPYCEAQLPVEELEFSERGGLISKFFTPNLWLPFRSSKGLICGELARKPSRMLVKDTVF